MPSKSRGASNPPYPTIQNCTTPCKRFDGYGHGVITDRLQVVADGEDTRMTEIEEPGTKSGEAFASILHFLPLFSYCKDMPWPCSLMRCLSRLDLCFVCRLGGVPLPTPTPLSLLPAWLSLSSLHLPKSRRYDSRRVDVHCATVAPYPVNKYSILTQTSCLASPQAAKTCKTGISGGRGRSTPRHLSARTHSPWSLIPSPEEGTTLETRKHGGAWHDNCIYHTGSHANAMQEIGDQPTTSGLRYNRRKLLATREIIITIKIYAFIVTGPFPLGKVTYEYRKELGVLESNKTKRMLLQMLTSMEMDFESAPIHFDHIGKYHPGKVLSRKLLIWIAWSKTIRN
ncbi:hypothetical protein KGM_213747 [Danaus plexippus plexippus]|uniref:Uncharacterized protein n=1 Tax=Danaus plexippus plexippus TaxID=278856 RepID=A0A212F9B0_DANPL|nr:hypothetical protein KGM_213747 [Danaus plexippus plexippus]